MKTKIFTLLGSALLASSTMFAQDWVTLHPLSSVSNVDGDLQVLDVWDDNGDGPSQFDKVHLWGNNGGDGQKIVINDNGDGYFWMQSISQVGTVIKNADGVYLDDATINDPNTAPCIEANWENEAKVWNYWQQPGAKWTVTREGTDKHYVLRNIDNNQGEGSKCLSTSGASGTETGDAAGVDVGSAIYSETDIRQQWEYYGRSKDNYDPLAMYIQGNLDEGLLDNGNQTEVDYDQAPNPINSKLDAGGGNGNVYHTWKYGVVGILMVDVTQTVDNGHPIDADNDGNQDVDDQGNPLYYYVANNLPLGALGPVADQFYGAERTEAGILNAIRYATDGTTTVESVTIQLAVGVKDALAISKDELSSVKIFPNPATNSVTITAKNFDTVEIFNTLGQSLNKLDGGKKILLNTSEFKSGLYLVKLSNKNTTVTKQLVIR